MDESQRFLVKRTHILQFIVGDVLHSLTQEQMEKNDKIRASNGDYGYYLKLSYPDRINYLEDMLRDLCKIISKEQMQSISLRNGDLNLYDWFKSKNNV